MSMILMVKAMKTKVGSPLTKLVLLKMADNANDQGQCYPSYQYIADQCEISKRSAMIHIKKLCDLGMLRKSLRASDNPQVPNVSNYYTLTLGSESPALGVVNNLHPPSESPAPPPSESPAPKPVTLFNQSYNLKEKEDVHDKDGSLVQEVFEYWQRQCNHPRAKLDKKRRGKIKEMMKEGFDENDLMDAIDGVMRSEYHVKEGYTDIVTIFRDVPQVEKFMEIYRRTEALTQKST